MAYDVNGLERTIYDLETSFIGIRCYDTVSSRNQVLDALSRIISPQGNGNRPVHDEIQTYGDHEKVLVTTRTRQRASNVTKTARERTARTSDSVEVRKRNGTRQRSRKQTKNPYEDDEQRVIR